MGDPTEIALLLAARDAGIEREGRWRHVRVTASVDQVVDVAYGRLLDDAQGRDMSEREWCVPARPWC